MANLIYIGVIDEIDTDESDNDGENTSAVHGTYGSFDMSNVTVEMSSAQGDGYTKSDDNGQIADTFTYDTGAGETTSELDFEARYFAKITEPGGVVHDVQISVYQTANGDTFVRLPNGYDVAQLEITGIASDGYSQITQNASSTSTVVCFCAGTLIATIRGPTPIEDLAVGDKVWTQDHGYQAITWIDNWVVGPSEKTAPIRIRAGALGKSLPSQDLKVSRQHRLYVTSKIVERMFECHAVLVPAHALIGLPGIELVEDGQQVHYYHFTCANHEIICANGVLTETLLPGTQARKTLGALAGTVPSANAPATAVRHLASGAKARRLAWRHKTAAKSLGVPLH